MTWFEALPAEMTVDIGGQATPLRDVEFVKNAPDLPTFVKMAYDTHREVGARIPLKIDKNNPEAVNEWRKTHMPRFYEAGLLSKPPVAIEEYGAIKPENLPKGLGWNDDIEKEFKTTLLKHGVPKEAASELIQLHLKTLGGATELFHTDQETGMAALKTEHGDKLDERMEKVKRLTPMIFKTEKELQLFEDLGLGNHPGFLGPLLRMAHLAESDSSFITSMNLNQPSGGMTGEAVRAEMGKIMSDKTHPMHAGWHRKDPETMKQVDEMYKKAYGDGKVDLGATIVIGRPTNG